MKQLIKYALPFCLTGLLQTVNAIPLPQPQDNRTDHKLYAALSWSFVTTPGMPNIVLGARTITVKSNDHLSNGADLSVQFSTAGGLALDSIRLMTIGGKRNGFYGAGIGYNFKTRSPLFAATVGAPHARLIGDYNVGNGVDGLIQIETLSKPNPVQTEPTPG